MKLRFRDLERSMHTLFQSISNGLAWGEVANGMYKLQLGAPFSEDLTS